MNIDASTRSSENTLWEDNAQWWIDGFTDGADAEYEEQILPLAAEELQGMNDVLDVGCGDGQVSRLVKRLGAQFVAGIDPTWNQVTVAAGRGGGLHVSKAGADGLPFFDESFEMDRIIACAQMASIADDIAKMPMGYNSLIGDMGSALSGGQKQRILLARALYRRPKILFLDEATSQLDMATEAVVSSALQQLQITRIIIAHRPETIASADRVLTLPALQQGPG